MNTSAFVKLNMIKLEYVIRTIGERTEDVCIELVRRQKGENEKITIVNETTHVDAIEKTFMLGLQSDAEWLVAIDADMLLVPGGISAIRKEIKSYDADVFVSYPAIYDKLYSMRRWGVTIYRVSMLEELYEAFKELKKNHHLKIEGGAVKAVAKGGKKIFQSRNVVALHDFYQYYKDLYRKVYLNTIRNPGYNKKAKKKWAGISSRDADYRVMLQAMNDAQTEARELTNSVGDFTPEELFERIERLGLKEKGPLLWRDFVDESLKTTMSNEMHLHEKYKVLNDYFEYNSKIKKFKIMVVQLMPPSILEPYRRIKAYINDKTVPD